MAMKYITKKEYFDFSGIDLGIELKGSPTDNPTKIVTIFLTRVEDWLLSQLKIRYFIGKDDEEFNEEAFKKALLHQVDYVRLNGELSVKAANEMAVLAPNAFVELKIGNMTTIVNPRTYIGSVWG